MTLVREGRHVKVLVLGPGEAGKSTLVGRLCGNAMNVAVKGRTVGLDHGTRRYEGVTFHFFGVPGQERFAPVQEALLLRAAVAVVVLPLGGQMDALTAHWCKHLIQRGVPLVAVYNRFAGEQPDQLMRPPHIPFLRAFTYDLANANGFEELLDTLLAATRKET